MQYSEEELSTIIKEMLRQVLRVKIETIIPEARIFSDLGAESLDILDIRFRLEKILGISIADTEIIDYLGTELSIEEIDNAFTVKSMMDYATNKINLQSTV